MLGQVTQGTVFNLYDLNKIEYAGGIQGKENRGLISQFQKSKLIGQMIGKLIFRTGEFRARYFGQNLKSCYFGDFCEAFFYVNIFGLRKYSGSVNDL